MASTSSQTSQPGHFVAAFGLIRNATDEVLMIRSPRRGWELPGGQVEQGEDLFKGLKREIREESGVHVEVGQLAGVYSRVTPPFIVLFGFLGQYESGVLTPSPESELVEWVQPGQVLSRVTHDAIRDRIQDLLTYNGQVVYRSYSTDPYEIFVEHHL